MASPWIWAGQFAKSLQAQLNIADRAYVLTGTIDPRVVATLAPKASLYLRQGSSGQVFQKIDDGSTTNWKLMLTEASSEYANELKETLKNYLNNSYYDTLVYNIPAVDGNGKLDVSSTATYDVTTDTFRFTAPAQTVVSIGLLDADFLASGRDVDSIDFAWQWLLGSIDTAATYEASRDGGAHWQTVTMDRISASNDTYQGSFDFSTEQTAANQSFATYTNSLQLSDTAGTNERLAQKLEYLVDTYVSQASMWLTKVDSGTLAGNFRVKMVMGEYTATPATLANATAANQQIGMTTDTYVGQTFTTPASDVWVNSITIQLRNPSANAEVQPIRLIILPTTAGDPSNQFPLAMSETIYYVTDVPATNTSFTFNFATPVRLSPSTVYAWAVQAHYTSAPNLDLPSTTTDSFAGGQRFTMSLTTGTATLTAGQDMTGFSVNYETRAYRPSDGVMASTDWTSASSVPASPETEYRVNLYQKVPAGVYFMLIETDDAYKASYSLNVRSIHVRGNTASGDATAYREDGGVWSSIALAKLAFNSYSTADAAQVTLATYPWSTAGGFTATSPQAQAQKLVISSTNYQLTKVTIGLRRNGSPTGGFRMRIVNDAGGVPSLVAADTRYTSSYVDVSTIYDDYFSFDVSNLTLLPGTYHCVFETDAAYKTQYTSSRNIGPRQQTVGSGGGRSIYDGVSWTASPTLNLTSVIEGRVLDLRVRVTSSVGSVETLGYGVLYDRPQGLIATGIPNVEVFSFNSLTNQTSFTISKFLPNPDLLVAYHAQTGQAWRFPAFDIQGQTISFPANFFGNGGESGAVTLIFDQTRGGAFDNSDRNLALLAANHLGSLDPTISKAAPGRGPILQSPDGTLYELTVQDGGGGLDIYEVTP